MPTRFPRTGATFRRVGDLPAALVESLPPPASFSRELACSFGLASLRRLRRRVTWQRGVSAAATAYLLRRKASRARTKTAKTTGAAAVTSLSPALLASFTVTGPEPLDDGAVRSVHC